MRKYLVRLLHNGEFSGYLSVKGRMEWKTKHLSQRHAKEFCEAFGSAYSFVIEEN